MASSAGDRWIHFPFLLELRSYIHLPRKGNGMPAHVKHLRGWAKEIFGGAMAIKTPLHTQRLGLMHDAHLIDRTVATVATHAPIHMHGMIEVGVIWQAVNLYPGDWLTRFPTFAHWGKTRTVGENLPLTMAVDTGLRGGKIRVGCHFDKTMAISAIHTELLHMECM